jgi:hypothetical protein
MPPVFFWLFIFIYRVAMELIEDLRRKMKNKLKTLLPPILTLFTLLAIIGCYTALKPSTQQNDVLYSLKKQQRPQIPYSELHDISDPLPDNRTGQLKKN